MVFVVYTIGRAYEMENGSIRRNIKSQSSFEKRRQGITVGILALAIVIALGASYGVILMLEKRAHSSAESLVSDVVEHINGKMSDVEKVTREAAQVAGEELYNPDELEKLVQRFVKQNDFVYGSTVAFEPDVFPDRGRCFAPYSWKTSDGEVHSRQLGTETDYYQEEWYAETKEIGNEYWCEPYYDEGGAKIMMCTFSVPLKDSDGKLVAVMTADVGLEDLEEYISSIRPSSDSYILLRSKKGNTLVNAELESETGYGNVIIKGITSTGWSVELTMPFTYLMRGDTQVYFLIGIVFLIAILFIYFCNLLLTRQQERSSAEYMNVIDAVSSGFSSIYTVNLFTKETFVFRNPESYKGVINIQKSDNLGFTEILSKLIDYDCHSLDREMMHKEIDLETIREKLTRQDRYDVRFRKETDGRITWYEMRVFVLERDATGTPVRAVVAFTDVNESVLREKEAQETLEHALFMAQDANRAKTNFLFNMSHDIRTPMNAIMGFTSMAKKHIDDKDRLLDCIEKTQQSGNLLLSLINSVLEVSRIESGNATIEEQHGDVYYSFANIENTMHELAHTKDIDLSFEFGSVKNRYVYVDISRCMRVFVNIISNAIKYTPAGGTVKVRCEQVGEAENGHGTYRYTFSDNGIGMGEEFQKHVFEQFARENSATVSGIQGTGLGLAVCKSFVELMGGTIECQSRQGEGTTFTVILPFRIQEGEKYTDPVTGNVVSLTDDENAIDAVTFDGEMILLVEDNELNREIAFEILEDEGFMVEEAEDGLVAVERLREKGPDYYDFILMDIQMPNMNGYEATKAIREMYPDRHIPIIALSANAFAEDRAASIAAGMDDHVAKPINIKELFGAISRLKQQ